MAVSRQAYARPSRLVSGLARNQEWVAESAEKTRVFDIGVVDANSPPRIADPGLAIVGQKWVSLPPAVRAGILAMVNTAAPDVTVEPVDEATAKERRAARA